MGDTAGEVAPSQLPEVERRGDGKDSTLQGDCLAHVGCKLLESVRLPARRDCIKDRRMIQYIYKFRKVIASVCMLLCMSAPSFIYFFWVAVTLCK